MHQVRIALAALMCLGIFPITLHSQTSNPVKQPAPPAPPPIPGPAAGLLTGAITGEQGMPVAGALVVAHRRWTPTPTTAPPLSFAFTDARGRYMFSALPPGSYLVCASVKGLPVLDPCAWSGKPPAWNLSAGEMGVLDIRLRTGVFLHVRVDDVDQGVAAREKTGHGGAFSVGVWTTAGGLLPAQFMAQDPKGRNLQVLVPADTDLRLALNPGTLAFEDAKGKPLKAGPQDLNLRLRADETAPILRIRAREPGKP